jgi:uncharacterized protein YprB with RNaseH-like and TPR domain
VDLRRKLARLVQPPSATQTAESLVVPSRPEPAAEPRAAEPSSEGASGADRLSALRSQLDALVARSRQRERTTGVERREARAGVLGMGFEEECTPEGPLFVRRIRYARHARVGHAPLDAAIDADAGALCRLALDDSFSSVGASAALYFDTETTGLAGGTGTLPFLIGLGFFEDRAFVVEQLLLRAPGEELPMLVHLAARIGAASSLVSFNGKSFDWPLLRTRFVMNRCPVPPPPPHLDLVHVARRIHRRPRKRAGSDGASGGPQIERWDPELEALVSESSCKLVAIERKLLGFERVDDVPSGEIPARYAHFLRTGDGEALGSVCDHNAWDVASMAALLGVYATSITSLAEPHGRAEVPLAPEEWVGLAQTLARSGDLAHARRAADRALAEPTAPAVERRALHTRARIAKRADEVETAQADLESLSQTYDDAEARLELAKLYEHRLRDPVRALDVALAGTSEPAPRAEVRTARLRKKKLRGEQLAHASLGGSTRGKRR